jgi:flagellar biosynthesis protein FlhG
MIGQAERVIELRNLAEKSSKKSLKITAFSSGKGGTGKTFISINTAYALSKLHKRVLFIDLDTNLSNANIMINHIPTQTIYSCFFDNIPLDDAITKIEPNLHFIFGDSGKTNYPQLTEEAIDSFYQQLKKLEKNYDFIFLDLGSGADDQIIKILMKADQNIIITTPEPTSIMDAYVVLKILRTGNYSGLKGVVINKCASAGDGESAHKNLNSASAHFLKENIDLFGIIYNDAIAGRSIMEQNLLTKSFPNSRVGIQILRLARKIMENHHLANIQHPF